MISILEKVYALFWHPPPHLVLVIVFNFHEMLTFFLAYLILQIFLIYIGKSTFTTSNDYEENVNCISKLFHGQLSLILYILVNCSLLSHYVNKTNGKSWCVILTLFKLVDIDRDDLSYSLEILKVLVVTYIPNLSLKVFKENYRVWKIFKIKKQ